MPRGTRLSGTLPVSVAVHLFVVGLLLVAPLLADITLPPPATSLPEYLRAVPVPAPPPVARVPAAARRTRTERAFNANAAPTAAPSGILPERATADTRLPEVEGGIGTGVPIDAGVIVREPAHVIDAPPPKPASTVRVAELPQPPRKLVDARPAYPDIARSARIEGTVVLEAIIDRTGRVDDVRVIRSVPLLDQAAIDAVRQWRYAPSVLRGQPVAVLMTITVNFRIQ